MLELRCNRLQELTVRSKVKRAQRNCQSSHLHPVALALVVEEHSPLIPPCGLTGGHPGPNQELYNEARKSNSQVLEHFQFWPRYLTVALSSIHSTCQHNPYYWQCHQGGKLAPTIPLHPSCTYPGCTHTVKQMCTNRHI